MGRMVTACVLSLGIGLGVGLGAGWEMHPAASPADESGLSPQPTHWSQVQPAEHRVPVSTGIDRIELRAMLHEELASILASRGSALGAATTQEAPTPPSQELLSQRHEATDAIDGMIAGGVWGPEQRNGFREKLGVLDPEQRDRALQQLMVGINSGTIRVNVEGAPF